MAVDDQSVVSFSIPQGTLPWQPIFVAFIHGWRWELVAQPGGLTLSFTLQLRVSSHAVNEYIVCIGIVVRLWVIWIMFHTKSKSVDIYGRLLYCCHASMQSYAHNIWKPRTHAAKVRIHHCQSCKNNASYCWLCYQPTKLIQCNLRRAFLCICDTGTYMIVLQTIL